MSLIERQVLSLTVFHRKSQNPLTIMMNTAATGRRRLNINGTIDLDRPVVRFDETINADSPGLLCSNNSIT